MSGGFGFTLEGIVANGKIVDLILFLMALEGVALVLIRRVTGRGVPPAQVIAFLASGAALMMALKAALLRAGWIPVAAALAVAGIAHAADLWLRWRDPKV